MPRTIIFLAFLLFPASGSIVTNIRPHYVDALKATCDALPYRSVYHQSNCYFVIDADIDSVRTSESCSRVLKGAKLTGKTPAAVFNAVFGNKSEFLGENESTGKKMKAMCVQGTRFPCLAGLPPSDSYTCIREEEQKIDYQLRLGNSAVFKEKITPGQTIVLKGVASGGLTSFCMSLADNHDNMFSIEFRFSQDKFGMNTWSNGRWIADRAYPSPLRKDIPFDIRIRALADRFQVFLNGELRAEYTHILPLSSITNQFVTVWPHGAWGTSFLSYFQLGEQYEPLPSQNAMINSVPICKKAACDSELKGYECKSLVVSGVINNAARKGPWNGGYSGVVGGQVVFIDLVLKNGDTALRFAPRIDSNHVAMNTMSNGKWQVEEIEKKMPFKIGVRFEVSITRKACSYQIAVDGRHFYTYAERLPPVDIKTVIVQGIDNLDIQVK